MARYAQIENAALGRHLCILGGLHPEDMAGVGTLLLLGPDEPGFWPAFTAAPEYQDGLPDPMDRWSAREIGALATGLGAQALFPFGGPPFQPFIQWAKGSGRAFASPVGLLVHEHAGLFVSYRGALGFAERIGLPAPPAAAPCDSCDTRPCLSACPVDALGDATVGYDVATCKDWLHSPQGRDCMAQGCAVRRACPISRAHGRVAAQSAFHMEAFR
ncbi:ferredoxin [Thalassovita taeanensis]|uniref:4Fe-4S ferredoxin-type domain-containing protein n=1 Tax=Thalassovita taeanensis TaxID=657014 RepID=A0A1H9DZ51_9RHOB|nr:ferredoxin [Thalassovita taeanensis]SEQ18183.1 hypothetical protein SAMN04488092_104320 [Thalassovita taeanensis]